MASRVRTDKEDAIRHARRIKFHIEAAIQHLKDLPHYERDYPVVEIMSKQEFPPLLESTKVLIEEIETRPPNRNI